MKFLFGALMLSLLSLNIACNRDRDDSVMERQEDRMERAGDKIEDGAEELDGDGAIEDGAEELDN